MSCPRCSDCVGHDHHWLPNGDFGGDEDEAENPTGNEYICKHCDAVGDDCERCDGTGEVSITEDDCHTATCPVCDGEGIVVSCVRCYDDIEF